MILSKAAVNASVEVLVGFQTARRWEKQHMCSVDLVADWRDECFPLCHHFFTLRADLWQTPSHSWGEALAVRAQADPPWRAGCEARNPPDRLTGWGSPKSSVPARRHAPALGAVRCSGAERWVRTHPTACSAVDCLHAAVLNGAKRRTSRDETALSSQGSPARIVSWITMKGMFLKCFYCLF